MTAAAYSQLSFFNSQFNKFSIQEIIPVISTTNNANGAT